VISHEPIEATDKLFARTQSRVFRDWIRVAGYLVILAVFLALLGGHCLHRFENMALDFFLKSAGPAAIHPDIALIEISNASLEEVGAWPWPRSYYAIITRLLSEWKAAAVVLDLDLTEATDPGDDGDLARVIAGSRASVYLPVDLRPKKAKKFWIHGLSVVLNKDAGEMGWVHALPEFEKAAKGTGHHDLAPDPDGVLRRFDPVLTREKESHPFLALVPVLNSLKRNPAPASSWNSVKDDQGKVLIPWAGSRGEGFQCYAFEDLIHSYYAIQKGLKPVMDPEKIAGKICLVGLTARGIAEFKTMPFDVASPALRVYASILNGALTGNWIRPVPFWAHVLCLTVIGLGALFLFLTLQSTLSLAAGLMLGLAWTGICFFVFWKWHVWLFVVYPAFFLLTLFVFSALYIQATAMREKSALFHLATRDGLTELYVIRHFRLIMNQIVLEASVRREPLSILLFDIDNFKKINDTYGHPAGDMVLKKLAAIILAYIRKKRPFREIDFAARYGGEEFIIILRKSGLDEAVLVAGERIRKQVEATKFEWGGTVIPVTISVGAATLRSGENVPDPMVRRADAALYEAKRAGKNRVCAEKD
jgi:diguanylate cyclase (GGDEF)-like protein